MASEVQAPVKLILVLCVDFSIAHLGKGLSWEKVGEGLPTC